MNKKFLSLVLALVMVLGTFGNVFAAAATDKKEANDVKDVPKLTSTDAKVQWLIDNSIVIGNADDKGNPTGDMDLKSPIRRDAVAKMLVYAIGEKDLADKLQGVYRPFPDVEVSNIMNGYIAAAASRTSVNNVAIINGYEDGMFRPTNNVTYAELAKMLVVAIDKDLTQAKADSYKWYQDWINRAVQLGIFDGLSIDKPNDPAVRKDAFAMIYNAFYKLKEIKAVPSNETRGIISERSLGDKLVLNQGDFKKEFKVTANTVFVNQANRAERWLANRDDMNKYYVGSLVRVLTDKDGVATHVIEMGNPVNGVQNRNTAWVDLGNQTLEVAHSDWTAKANDVRLNDKNIAFNNTTFDVTSKTVFYVADNDKNVLTQVKDYAAARAYVSDKDMTSKVYLAYEKLPSSGVKEAKVVVFNKASVPANERLVRIARPVSNQSYRIDVQAPGESSTTVEQFDLSKVDNAWPYNYQLEQYDVVKLIVNGGATTTKAQRELVIDYSEAPVYKVEKFLSVANGKEVEVNRANANAVLLSDKDGYQKRFDLPSNYDKFFGVDFKKGVNVQIALRKDTAGKNTSVIDVVSVVNLSPRGILADGVDSKLVKGEVVGYVPVTGQLGRVHIKVDGDRDATVFVTSLPGTAFGAAGTKVEATVKYINKDYNMSEVVSVKQVAAPTVSSKMQAYNDALVALQASAPKAANVMLSDKGLIQALVKAYDALETADKTAKTAEVNEYIVAYNKLSPDKLEEVK